MSHFLRTIKRKEKDYFQLNAKVHDQFGNWKSFNKMTTLEATDENRAKAEAMAAEFEEIKRKELDPDCVFYPEMLVSDFLNTWLDRRSIKLRSQTVKTYRTYIRKVIPYLDRKKARLNNLRKIDLSLIFDELQYTCRLQTSTVRRIRNVIKKALKAAVEWEYIQLNPAEGIEFDEEPRKNKPVLTPEQINQILLLAKNRRIGIVIALAYYGGFRIGEVSALDWKNIDFENKTITICQVSEVNGNIVPYTKNESSFRTIPMFDTLYEVLKNHKEQQDKERNRYSSEYKKADYVFTLIHERKNIKGRGRRMSYTYIAKETKKVFKELGLEQFTFHSLRHACISKLLQEFDPTTVANWVGHSSPATTMQYYAHAYIKAKKQISDRGQQSFGVDFGVFLQHNTVTQ